MKYKLLISPSILKPYYQVSLAKTLVVYSSTKKEDRVKNLLEFIFDSYKFALDAKPEQLYLSTEDDFLLPPNA